MINFKTGNELRMKVIDFGVFQRKIQMPTRDKYLIDMLFGASQGTSRMVSNMRFFWNSYKTNNETR